MTTHSSVLEVVSLPDNQPVDKIMTVAPGEAISGLTPYEPIPLALTYEIERFGKTIELPIAAYCPFCRNEFTKDRHDRLVTKSSGSDSSDYCYDLDILVDDDGEPYMKCQRCGGTTKQINPDPEADADRLHELTRPKEVDEVFIEINGAIESFGSILMPMDEFKRVGKALAKDPSLFAIARIETDRYKIDWQTLRTKVRAFKRGRDEWPGVEVKFWTPR